MMGTCKALYALCAATISVAATACAPAEQGVKQAQTGDAVVVLSEGECEQTCPVYDMTLHPGGAYVLNGVKFVKSLGVSEGKLAATAWDEAEQALKAAGFWTLSPNQTSNATENCHAGAPTVRVTWRTVEGKEKTITYTAGCGDPQMRTLVIALRETLAFGDLVWTDDRFSPDGAR
jgi:ABC-type sulfate/molybdate transport systems ATPase subunit